MPSNRAPRVEAASAGASMVMLPPSLAADLELREELPDLAHARQGGPALRRREPPRSRPVRASAAASGIVAGTASAAASAAGSAMSLRLVAGLDHLLERVGDLVVEPDVGEVGQLDLLGPADGRGGGQGRGVVELLDPRQERPGLVELDRVAVAVEEALEERLLGADQVGDPRLDALLADQVVDVDRLLLAEPVDPADPLLEHGRVPGELEVDHAVGGALEVEPDAAGVAGEEDAEARGRRGTRRCSGSAASAPRRR